MKKMWKGGVLFVLCVLCLYTANEAKATSKTSDEAINWVKSQVGNLIDADGAYGAQCVDLIRAYYNFLGVAQVRGNGCDYATNQLPSGWTRIKGAQPQKGDILVYTGGYGHVAIYESDYVTYHQNYNGKKKVTRETFAYNSPAYITNYTPYWGVVRPNFSSGNIGAYGEMTTPTIHTDKEVYNVGETANISWAATSPNSDFYQYWLVVTNTTTKKEVYGGDPGVIGNPSVNSKRIGLPNAGRYYITVYAVPYNDKYTREKIATKYISVGTYGEMTTPTIRTNKEVFNVGEVVDISWTATSSNSDFYQYWLIVTNTSTKKKIFGGDPGVVGNPLINTKKMVLPNMGTYKIVVYAVPYNDKDSCQKMATKYIEVSNKTYTSANNVTESKLNTVKQQTYQKTGMTQAEIKKY